MSEPVEAYFAALRDIRASGAGVAETSYYGPLATLLDDVGRHLKPKVRAIINLRNTGGGIPDGGLFTAPQLRGWEPGENPLQGQLPNRGAIEVKGTADDAFATAASEQVARYVERYGLVLVTNLRDFVLVGRDISGTGVRTLESCSLAPSETVFWGGVSQPHVFATVAGEDLTEFLRRVLLHNAPLSDPKDLAWFLASYARTARLRLEHRHELPALDQLRSQLEDALGLKFEGEKGDHFFRSTLVQTLFYGMFASWVLWARDRDHTHEIPWDQRFQWETATATLHVPMVYELFRQFADVRQLGALGISEVLEWAEEVIWRIDRKAFFEKFREEHAVQYFYEPFLEAFDPQLRKELGVWYTPDEVVKYMVARVDMVLREELGIVDGLADESVVVLDPCCGTGAYLVEVLRKINETLTAKGADALTRHDVKRAAMNRIIGFEIMPAPFVVAHLNLGILLAELEVPLRDTDERAAVYLTNALTGWTDAAVIAPPKDRRVGEGQMHSTLLFPEFAHERDAAGRIKREERILVVIGNPPYNGFAGVAIDDEADLIERYRGGRDVAAPQGRGLNDLYVRFFGLAGTAIRRTDQGVACLITNYSWLDGLSFTAMRESILEEYDKVIIDNLNGDRYRTGKLTPEGLPDPSVMSTAHNREGIQVGTAITTLIKAPMHDARVGVAYRDVWGEEKRAQLLAESLSDESPEYVNLSPTATTGCVLRPGEAVEGYSAWPRLLDLFPFHSPGVTTSRDDLVVDVDRDSLVRRMNRYLDVSTELAALSEESISVARRSGAYDPVATRQRLLAAGGNPGTIVRYAYRPFDFRWLYWEAESGLLDRARPNFLGSVAPGNVWLESRQRLAMPTFDRGLVVETLADTLGNGVSNYFPLYREGGGLVSHRTVNLSQRAQAYSSLLAGADDAIFFHAVASLHSPWYRSENAPVLRTDWPHVPLPAEKSTLERSASLGKRVASFLTGSAEPASLRVPSVLGKLSGVTSRPLDPATELGVTARWGVAGNGGVTMPSTGKFTERPYTADELAAVAKAAESLGLSAEQAIALLGETCFDIYLNDVAYWRCVPANVWRYTIGGYQVIKKWLSYRERALLGRDLKPEEARYVTEMVRRIAALVLMGPDLDANYERVKEDTWNWGVTQTVQTRE